MLLTESTYPFNKVLNDEEIFKMLKKAGFDGVDYCFSIGNDFIQIENIDKVKELLDKYNLVCNQAHAPFVLSIDDELSLDNQNFLDVVTSLKYAKILGAKAIVVHAIKVPSGVDFLETNLNYYKTLLPYAKKYDIKIAVENLLNSKFWKPEALCNFVELLNSEYFTTCIDVGHSEITGVCAENYISGMKKGFIEYVHIQDTDCQLDRHWIPYQGNHNWDNILKALANYGFNGDMNLEIIHSFDNLPIKLYPAMLEYIAKVGKFMIEEFEKHKRERIL